MTEAPDYSDLSALFLSCTLTPSPAPSHTETLMRESMAIMQGAGVRTELIRVVDHPIAPGVQPDLSDTFPDDAWPQIYPKVLAADILVLGTPIWLGEKSSECTKIVERLYAHSSETNDAGQYVYYGKVGGMVVTGNEDGYKHASMNLTFSLQHMGFTVPPQADTAWVGEAGPGPSYGDETDDGVVGLDNDFTQQLTTFSAWNLMHMAALLKRHGGVPAYGPSADRWQAGERFGHPRASQA